MAKKKSKARAKKKPTVQATKPKERSGLTLEKVVARIQQMMDPNSTVSHNERLEDRVGNRRQYDVVVRGSFGGRPMLGVIECKDHNRKKGPDAVEAFAKKTENLGANLRLMVCRKGFTDQALKLARHEHIGCLSLLPADPKQAGFSIGGFWYGKIYTWQDFKLTVIFNSTCLPIDSFDVQSVKWEGKLIVLWFAREFFTNKADETREGEHQLYLEFDQPRSIEIEQREYEVKGIACVAIRAYSLKRKWVSWSGDALYDWHSGQFTVPGGGKIVGSPVETDLSSWPDYEGEIPLGDISFCRMIAYGSQAWDENMDNEIPDLSSL